VSNFNKSQNDPFGILEINPDNKSHIHIKNRWLCVKKCENKPCTYFCPTRVYSWADGSIQVDYSRCIECGACPFGCPMGNINWVYPAGGYGVVYHY
jgi:ferredoxin like protein